MAKPTVKLLGPTWVVIGRIYTFQLVVTVDKPTRIERIVTGLRGRQGWAHADRFVNVDEPNLAVDVSGRRVLTVGSHGFPVQFEVPRTTSPTHNFHPAFSWLQVVVRIHRPWWVADSVHAWDLQARMPPPQQVVRKHATIGTSPAKPTDPRIEVALASSTLVAGETMRGACAVFHLDDREPREVELSLVAIITVMAQTPMSVPGPVLGTRKLFVAAGGAGTSVPFAIPLSVAACPSFRSSTHAVSWQLRVRSGSFFAGKAEAGILIDILDPAAAAIAPPMGLVPRLGDDRIAGLFAVFGARAGWREAYPADDDASIMIERDVADSTLQLAYAYRGAAGTHLIARVVHPSLGLGLSVTPASLAARVFTRDLEIDDAEWDRAHHVVARSAAQTIPVLKPSAHPMTRATGALGKFISWTDTTITYENMVTKVDDADLVKAGLALEALAVALAPARALVTPPLPVDLAAYRGLGQWLSAPIVVGDLSITGKLGSVPVAVKLAWQGEQPTGVQVSAGNPDATSEMVRQISVELATADHVRRLPDQVPDALRDRLGSWPTGVVDVRIVDGVASATLPIGGGFDVARVRELVQWSSGIVAALDPGAGPYR